VETEKLLPQGMLMIINFIRIFQIHLTLSQKFSYRINYEGYVTLHVYNLVGQVIRTLVSETQSPGKYEVEFDASEFYIRCVSLQVAGQWFYFGKTYDTA